MKLRRPDGLDLAAIAILLAVFPPLGLTFGLDGIGTWTGAGGGLLFGLALVATCVLAMLARPRGPRSSRIRLGLAPLPAVRLQSQRRDLRWTEPGPGPV